MAARQSRTAAAAKADEPTTTLDEDTTAPSVTAPGDGPADTVDPDEVAVSQPIGELSEEALAAGTVNAVKPAGKVAKAPAVAEDDQRVEEYVATAPDGKRVRVRHNIDTGATEVLGAAE